MDSKEAFDERRKQRHRDYEAAQKGFLEEVRKSGTILMPKPVVIDGCVGYPTFYNGEPN